MGFCYTQSGALCCDVCGNSPARKIKCPVNYCQAYAACADCKAKVKAFDHSDCKRRHNQMHTDQADLRAGRSTVTLYECSEVSGKYWRIREDGPSFAACCIFNKTWVDAPEIEQIRAWGNTVIQEVAA